jgi:potassium-transporting ATPase KdpC subunit
MRRQLLTSAAATLVIAVIVGIIYPVAVWAVGQVAFKYRANGSFVKNAKGQVVGSPLICQEFLDKQGNPLAQYFQPRPSAAGTGCAPGGTPPGGSPNTSGATNLGPGDPRLVGFIPGLNAVDLNGNTSATNPFATPADPYCVPTNAKTGAVVYSPPIATGQQYAKNKDGTYVCDPNTVPELAIAYRQLNGLDPKATVPVDAVTSSFSGLDPDISAANADLQAARVAQARHMALPQLMSVIHAHTNGRLLGVIGENTINVLDLNLALDKLAG